MTQLSSKRLMTLEFAAYILGTDLQKAIVQAFEAVYPSNRLRHSITPH